MQPWSEISKCTDFINKQTFLLPDLLSLVVEYAFELDVFNNFHNLFKRKCYKSRPNYPFSTNAKCTSLGFVYSRTNGTRSGEMEVFLGDLCGYFFLRLDTGEWMFLKQDRCTLLDAIITQSNIPKSVKEAALLDAKEVLHKKIIPKLCAYVASCRFPKNCE
jgi:hypothetical protein